MSCWCPLCTVQQPIFVGEEHISSLWSRTLVRANWKNQKIQRIPSRAICSKQTTLSIAVRRFWIASCLAMLPNKLCSWRNKAASASYSPKRKERDLARNRAKSLELQDVSFKIPKKYPPLMGFLVLWEIHPLKTCPPTVLSEVPGEHHYVGEILWAFKILLEGRCSSSMTRLK